MTETEIPLILNEEEYKIIDEFMNHQAGRTFDMRKPEHRVAHKILMEILTQEIPKHVPR